MNDESSKLARLIRATYVLSRIRFSMDSISTQKSRDCAGERVANLTLEFWAFGLAENLSD